MKINLYINNTKILTKNNNSNFFGTLSLSLSFYPNFYLIKCKKKKKKKKRKKRNNNTNNERGCVTCFPNRDNKIWNVYERV
jgi:hypothetical protein